MKIRIKFAKEGVMKYVGHLDMMRYFQKAIRRAHIPIKYSEGFNPHQIMSFAAPLGVGITSVGEYLDIEITEENSSAKAIEALNDTMVDGMKILQFKQLPDNAKNAMSSVAAASYILTYKNGFNPNLSVEEIEEKKQQFFDQAKEINIIKKTKKSERELDLKPLIYQFEVADLSLIEGSVSDTKASSTVAYQIMVSTGSTDNIKPELVLSHFHEFAGIADAGKNIQVHRLDMYTSVDGSYVSLGEVGQEIK